MTDSSAHQSMPETLRRLAELLATVPTRLAEVSEREVEKPRTAESWSAKEILGHLIDSAANNHQRFVRMQTGEPTTLPGYAQEFWVDVQAYREEPWADLIALWTQYNRHLLHVLTRIPPARLEHSGVVAGESVTLGFVVTDYVSHMEQHLRQILG
jgi:hypothetical protein